MSSLTSNVQDAIDQVVSEWMSNDKVFTAHDVKMEVRQRGYWILHNECRNYVHTKFENGDFLSNYERDATYLHTGNGSQYVMVFFPDHLEPTNHPNAVTSGVPVTATVAPTVTAPVSSVSTNSDVVQVDRKNRIRIPSAVTDVLGWEEGTSVRVAEKNGVVEITEVYNDAEKTHTVDCYGNIRITLTYPFSHKYDVKVVNTDVVAKPV